MKGKRCEVIMSDTSKYPHQSATWVLFIVFVLLFLSGIYYYSQGNVCYHNIKISPHWESTIDLSHCSDYSSIGMLMFALSAIPITTFGVCLIPEDIVKCPKCGYEFGGE